MSKLEKVIKGLECVICPNKFCGDCSYFVRNENDPDTGWCDRDTIYKDALSLLKAQELPPVKPEKLEEVTTKWLDEMTAKERLEKIAEILDDWDGYRTAKGLAGLINEVWAYALYPVKAQEIPNINAGKWISVKDAMPPERETIFAKFKGTDKWNPAMFATSSEDVRVVVQFEDGTRKVWHDSTMDGQWKCEREKCAYPKRTVTHWMPNPELPKEG